MEADNVNNEDFESHSRRISFDAVTQIATIWSNIKIPKPAEH